MAKNERRTARKPATKFPNLRKKLQIRAELRVVLWMETPLLLGDGGPGLLPAVQAVRGCLQLGPAHRGAPPRSPRGGPGGPGRPLEEALIFARALARGDRACSK